MYQNIVDTKESVHLSSWPKAVSGIDIGLENDMLFARYLAERIHAARKEKAIPVRQPLSKVTIHSDRKKISSELETLLCEEVNIKSVVWGSIKKEVQIVLDTTITPDLKAEGDMRELIRAVQNLRKTQKLGITQHIQTLHIQRPIHT